MTSITLTPQPDTASVLIQITGAPEGPVVITRTDANGTGPVRLRVGQEPIEGDLTLTDYEPALVGGLSYDVVDADGILTSASTSLAGMIHTPLITSVQLPALSASPAMVTGYAARREASSSVHWIVGRSDPVVVLGPTRTRTGRLDMWSLDHADALALAEVLTTARIVMLRQTDHPGLDMYLLASNVSVDPIDAPGDLWRWQTAADYVEVKNPALPLLGAAGWTWNDVVANYPTWAAVRSAFDDWGALLAGFNTESFAP